MRLLYNEAYILEAGFVDEKPYGLSIGDRLCGRFIYQGWTPGIELNIEREFIIPEIKENGFWGAGRTKDVNDMLRGAFYNGLRKALSDRD